MATQLHESDPARALQEARLREAAIREVVTVLNRSRNDDKAVFNVILDNALTLCQAQLGTLFLNEEGDTHQKIVAQRGGRSKWIEMYQTDPPPLDPAQSATARAMLDKVVLQIDDMADTDLYREGQRHRVVAVDEGGIRSALLVPLIGENIHTGAIAIYRREVRPFTEHDVELVSAFAEYAVNAIENARQFRELQTRLEREAASREILSVISGSRDDEKPVFDVILQNAARLCGAPQAGLVLGRKTDPVLTLGAHIGAREGTLELFDSGQMPMDPKISFAAKTIQECRIIHLSNLGESELYHSGSPQVRRMVDDDGIRTILFVPLMFGEEAIGAIVVYRREIEPFEEPNVELVKTFAAQAVIAIENVRQFRELQTRLEREAASREILSVISQSHDDEQPVFQVIHKSASRLCDAPFSGIYLISADGDHLDFVSHVGGNQVDMRTYGTTWPLTDVSAVVRAAVKRKVVHIEDLRDTDAYRAGHPETVKVVDEEGARTFLAVPLIKSGAAIGSIGLYRREARPFSADQIALVESFAAQSVIAIENIRQFRELQSRLKREQATSEVLGVINRSRDDKQPVFKTILEAASRLCGAPLATFGLVDEARNAIVLDSCLGVSPEYVAALNEAGLPLDDPRHATVRAVTTGQPVHVLDAAAGELYEEEVPGRALSVDMEGIRTFLVVPIMSGERGLGFIGLFRREVRAFDEAQISLLQNFAAQAAIAIENVRQFRELQTRLRREAANREILQVISRSRDDEAPVFDVILECASRLCEAPMAGMHMADDARAEIRMVAHRGLPDDTLDGQYFTQPIDNLTTTARAVREGVVIHTEDLADDLYRDGEPARVDAVDRLGARSALTVPLMSRDNALGCIWIFRREVRPYSEDEIALLQSFAAQAVIAIENVRQFRELEKLNAELGDRVEEQVGEIERMGRLKRFLPSAVADAVVSSGTEKMLASHRALLGILFCDIRGFTAFCERAEPEETIEVLQTYHEEMGRLISESTASVDHRMGDGIMVLFNDPLPCDDPAGDAVRLAMAMQARMAQLCKSWKRLGHRLGFGVGVSLGYATVGMVGSEGRQDYTASGTAVNLASRLCDQAADGETLLSPRAHIATEGDFDAEPFGEITLKGIQDPLEVFRVMRAKTIR